MLAYATSVPGTWYLVPGTWYLVPGTWNLVPSSWYQVPGPWYQLPGTKHSRRTSVVSLLPILLAFNSLGCSRLFVNCDDGLCYLGTWFLVPRTW